MEIRYKVESVRREHVIRGRYRYIIEAKSEDDNAIITLNLDEEHYKGMQKELDPLTVGAIIPILLPGEAIYDE